jgi:hypothetical protein
LPSIFEGVVITLKSKSFEPSLKAPFSFVEYSAPNKFQRSNNVLKLPSIGSGRLVQVSPIF